KWPPRLREGRDRVRRHRHPRGRLTHHAVAPLSEPLRRRRRPRHRPSVRRLQPPALLDYRIRRRLARCKRNFDEKFISISAGYAIPQRPSFSALLSRLSAASRARAFAYVRTRSEYRSETGRRILV